MRRDVFANVDTHSRNSMVKDDKFERYRSAGYIVDLFLLFLRHGSLHRKQIEEYRKDIGVGKKTMERYVATLRSRPDLEFYERNDVLILHRVNTHGVNVVLDKVIPEQKRCSVCKVWAVGVESVRQFFYRDKSKPSGLSNACKECTKKASHDDWVKMSPARRERRRQLRRKRKHGNKTI